MSSASEIVVLLHVPAMTNAFFIYYKQQAFRPALHNDSKTCLKRMEKHSRWAGNKLHQSMHAMPISSGIGGPPRDTNPANERDCRGIRHCFVDF